MIRLLRHQAGVVIQLRLYAHDRWGPRMTQVHHVWMDHLWPGPKV